VAQHPRTDEQLWTAVHLVRRFRGNVSNASRNSTLPLSTLTHQVRDAKKRFGYDVLTRPLENDPSDFTLPVLPDDTPSAEELLASRRTAYARKRTAVEARQLVPITVHLDGPVGIMHGGDPHLDDDGTDVALIERHVALVQATPGLLGANVGDYSNNWVGRLAHLYGQHPCAGSTSSAGTTTAGAATATPWRGLRGSRTASTRSTACGWP